MIIVSNLGVQMDKNIHGFFEEQISCLNIIRQDTKLLGKIVKILLHARDDNKKIFVMGNGGSGSTASHFVSDLLKTAITKDAKRFSAISLVDNIPVILAWSNDSSYENIFSEQLKNHVVKGDVVIGFSGSGNSQNVLEAFKFAKKIGAACIGFTGMGGGKLQKLCNVCHIVPSNDMLTIESTHLILCHYITSSIRNTGKPLFSYGKK